MPELSDLRRELGLLSEEDVAAIRDKSVSTLQKERCERSGPPWIKDGRTVLYFRDDLLAWLRAQREHTSGPDLRVEGAYSDAESSSLYVRRGRRPPR